MSTPSEGQEAQGISGGFDLGSAKPVAEREDEGVIIHLSDIEGEKMFYEENGEKKPVTWKVAGSYSNIYRRAKESQVTRTVKKGRSQSVTGELLGKQALELVAACSLGFDGLIDKGKKIPFSKDNAKVILDAAPWIREQVESAMEDHSRFFEASL